MSKHRALTFGSLFAGIGGFDLGFERAGMRCLWQVEIDADCQRLLAAKFPRAARFADIREAGAKQLAPADVICGGFPCQDLSIAGKRRGLKGKRSGLFYELKRIVNELTPRIVVWENVPGLFTADRGRDFARVIHALADIGYFGAWRVLDAQYIGVAQRRRRVFGVFARGDTGAACAAEILSLAEGLRGHPAPRRQTRESVAGTLGGGIGRGRGAGACAVATARVAGPLISNASGGRRGTDLDGNGAYIPVTSGTLNPGAHPGGCNGQDAHSNLLIAQTARAVTSKWAKGSGGPAGDECQNLVAECVTPGFHKADNNGTNGLVVFQPRVDGPLVGVRRLTPRECERLQGFPDDWTAGFSDSARYRMIGNAVAVPCAQWLGKRIRRCVQP